MKRTLMVTALLVGFASATQAQYPMPGLPNYGTQNALPYINLLQPNVNPALMYMGIVQPQLQAQNTFQQLQNQMTATRILPGGVAPPRNSGVADTGYAPARFLSYQHYFSTHLSPRGGSNQPQQTGYRAATFGGR